MKVSPDFFDSNSGLFFVYQNGFRKVYQLQIDLKEAKGQEFLKAIEEASTIVEENCPIYVEDTEKIDKLSAEVEELKHMIYEGMRSVAACNEFRHKKTTKAAHLVQANWHRHRDFKCYKRLMRSAIVAQTRWVGRVARKELRKLKAVRETRALQEENDKLQAQVEGLTWGLQLERMKLEEAKGQEIMILQNSLQEMKTKVDKTNALLTMERESSQAAIQEASANVEETAPIHVEDTEKIDKLSAEIEELKSLLESERNRANESEKKCNEALESSEIKQKKLEETVNMADQLEESLNMLLPPKALTTTQSTQTYRVRFSPQMQLRDDVDKQHQDLLIRCITQQLGFSKGRPVAACIIYKCFRQWRSFEVDSTNIFDRIIRTIGLDTKTEDNSDVLAYWLSNVSTLLLLLQRTIKFPQCRQPMPTPMFGRMAQSSRQTPQGVNICSIDGETDGPSESMLQVNAKFPALLFKQQLTAYVEKLYEMIRDNLKKEISPLLGLCIQDTLSAHWQGIVNKIGCFQNMLESNNVPPFLVGKIFIQIFSLINVHLFNSILWIRECCTYSYGQYVKAGLSELEHWCYKSTEDYAVSAWDELKHVRQAVGFLVAPEKQRLTLDQVRRDLCPVLSVQQLYRIGSMYCDEKFCTLGLSQTVIYNLRVQMMGDSNNALSNSFLLDDHLSMPFSADDLWKSMDQISIGDVEPPPLFRDNSAFYFLFPSPK